MTDSNERPISFHISMNVSSIDRSVDFFSRVFGVAPAKHRPDYAKFELQNPPITFSLEPVDPRERGALNHVGFKFRSAAELVEVQRRLEVAGIRSEREEGVECCYSKQTKFWLHDPDGTLWEMYILEGDIEHRGAGQSADAVLNDSAGGKSRPTVVPCSLPVVTADTADIPLNRWSHRLGSPLAVPEQHTSETLDEVALQGTFNAAHTEERIDPFLREVAAALKPSGTIMLHCLTADRHVDQLPTLPGPASVVKSVPCLNRLMDALDTAGFESVRLTTYRPKACFTAGDAELRETKLTAIKPVTSSTATADESVPVVFRGPFAEITLDSGETLQRGRRAEICRSSVDQLKSTPLADMIVVLEVATSAVSCTG